MGDHITSHDHDAMMQQVKAADAASDVGGSASVNRAAAVDTTYVVNIIEAVGSLAKFVSLH